MPSFDDSRIKKTVQSLHTDEEEHLLEILAPKYGLAYINLAGRSIAQNVLTYVPEETARSLGIAVFLEKDNTLHIATHNPHGTTLTEILDGLHESGHKTKLYLATARSLQYAWEQYHNAEESIAKQKGVLDVDPELIATYSQEITSYLDVAEKISNIVGKHNPRQLSFIISILFGGALALDASDIHIEPEVTIARIRYRLDGVLWEICDIESHFAKQITSRLKLVAGVKLNVNKEAQDGRFTFAFGDREVEVRTSIIPGAYGESVVMRLLDPNASTFNIEKLGMSNRIHEIITDELRRPTGAIITTGPTGSGKTTALYTFLNTIHKPDIKIITLEDPVEYKLPGIVQTQITKDYSFATGLRTILRQDPDVILVGEIRDKEVAETMVQAAQTGHLVFSTLHTNSAFGAIPRLMDMGIDIHAIISACNVFIGQRLVRKICERCKKEREMTVEEKKLTHRILGQPVDIHTVFEGGGCDVCDGSGYKGRTGIFEALLIDDTIEKAMLKDTRERAIREAAKSQNIPTMQQDGVMKVLAGVTTFDEISRVLDLYHLE
ncbi:MAG TPA: GspE/PulE family protein [Candidatus Paceibacterota bacterium]|nr:GspE/PulE family protein [Candidatus Paceibacterota bacterium]